MDYLKKIRKSRSRLVALGLLAVALITAASLFYLKHQQREADSLLAEQEQKTNELIEQIAQNAVSYDPASRTMVIYGNSAQAETLLPPEIEKAVYLDAQFDSYHLSAYLPHLRDGDMTLETDLPQYLLRTENSLKFIRSYLTENCADQYPAQRAGKYVELTIHPDEDYSWAEQDERIRLELGSYYWHREEMYILSLLGSETVQWKQLGYAWYLGSCLDPYSELLVRTDPNRIEEEPYGSKYVKAGGTTEFTPENYRKLNDAVACVCLEKGMYWGTPYESYPVRSTGLYKAPARSYEEADSMSVCMATSFIAWLSDQYGFDRVSSFCFDRASFEETFETDFSSAYAQWSAWILQNYAEQ